jgi:hypothetical protein
MLILVTDSLVMFTCQRYTELVEGSIEKRLKEAVPDFDMQKFQVMLDARKVGGFLFAVLDPSREQDILGDTRD